MMPNVTRGDRMAGLMTYLAGPGRSNEHTHPQLIAGHDVVTFDVEPGKELSRDDALDIASILDEPRTQFGTQIETPLREFDQEKSEYVTIGHKDAHVWHCSLSLKADEGELSPEKWAEIAHDFVDGMGFIDPDGAKTSRWAAIHHGESKNGNDHIHIAVQLVREDGTKADVYRDRFRAQNVVGEIEKKHGLVVLESRDKSRGLSGYKPAEKDPGLRQAGALPAPEELRRRMRSALASSSTQHQYVQKLMDYGVRVAPRFAKGSTERVVGYRVGLAPEKGTNQQTIYYAPSKIDRTLGWPTISERFKGEGIEGAERLLRGVHSGSIEKPDRTTKPFIFDPRREKEIMAGGVTPDTLSNIYARVSMSLERSKPGAFHQLSESYARAAQTGGNVAHAMRLSSRMASKDSTRGWLAVLEQANRLARAMTDEKLASSRPQLRSTVLPVLDQTDNIIRAEVTRRQKEQDNKEKAASTPGGGLSGDERAAQLLAIARRGQEQARVAAQDARAQEAEASRKVGPAQRRLNSAVAEANEAVREHQGLLSTAKNRLASQVRQDATRGREADMKVLETGPLTRGRALQAAETVRRDVASRWGVQPAERVKPGKQKQQSKNPFTGVQAQVSGLWSTWAEAVIDRHSPERLNTPKITGAHTVRVAAEERRDEAAARLSRAEQEQDQAHLNAVELSGKVHRRSLRSYLTDEQREELATLEGPQPVRAYRAPEEAQTRGPVLGSTRDRDSGPER